MGATQDPKYYRMSPYMSELISEGQEGRGGGGGAWGTHTEKNFKKMIYGP